MAATEHSQQQPNEGSKFKRFLRKFGRKASDDGQQHPSQQGGSGTASGPAGVDGLPATGKSRGNSLIIGKKTNSRSRNNSSSQHQQQHSHPATPITPTAHDKKRDTIAFGGNSGQGLADTLVMPDAIAAGGAGGAGIGEPAPNSPPPQLGGLPSHEPINATELADSSGALNALDNRGDASQLGNTVPVAGNDTILATDRASGFDNDDQGQTPVTPTATDTTPAPALSVLSSSPAQSRAETSFDVDSTVGTRRRDSSDNRTMDTGKSTKPTTLMSLDTREPGSGMASIAQYRHGDAPNGTAGGVGPSASSVNGNTASSPALRAAGGPASIQFASPPAPTASSRTASAANVNLPGQGEAVESSPYVNVPSISRPHPLNNPTPSGYPADNASVLTLASSTAAQSIGGAASSRGHYQTPSLGGARSIGGSLMGDRRNSSDTYASVKALPPLSRRGSDDSTRTGLDSVIAPSSNSISGAGVLATHQGASVGSSSNVAANAAATATGAAPFAAGPGAPADRIAMQRTNSQRTVATQLSIPLSNSASNTNLLASENKRSSTGSQHLLATNSTPNKTSNAATPAEQVAAADTSAGDGDDDDEQQVDSLPVPPGGLPEITQTSPSPGPVEQPLAA